jgi:TusA-related sulfurtransferase
MNKVHTEYLDVRGQVCPSTLLLTLREVNRLKDALHNGTTLLEVRTDNRHATVTIPNTVKSMGLAVRVHKEEQGYLIQIGAEKD